MERTKKKTSRLYSAPEGSQTQVTFLRSFGISCHPQAMTASHKVESTYLCETKSIVRVPRWLEKRNKPVRDHRLGAARRCPEVGPMKEAQRSLLYPALPRRTDADKLMHGQYPPVVQAFEHFKTTCT